MGGIFWLASYPKSGNTWLRAFIATLVSGEPADINKLTFLGGIASSRSTFDDALGIAAADLTLQQQANLRPRAYEIWAAEAEQPLYCKAHDCYDLTPAGEPLFPAKATRGAVYALRDPRAVAVSLAHHTGQTIDAEIARMADANATFSNSQNRLERQLQQRLQTWSNHVQSWLDAPFPVHVVRYEDMHADPAATFAALARFLDLPHGPERIACAVAAASFMRLQEQERATGFVERPRHAAAFFRDGRVDGWRDALTPAQVARIEQAHGPMMLRLGYELACADGLAPRIGITPSAA
jgi:aryl sulfotransferase